MKKNFKMFAISIISILGISILLFKIFNSLETHFLFNKSNNEEDVIIEKKIIMEQIEVATFSNNEKILAYRKNKVGDIVYAEVLTIDLITGEEKTYVKEISSINPEGVYIIKDVFLLKDEKHILVLDSFSSYRTGDLYLIDLESGDMKPINDGNDPKLIKEGKYKDYLLLQKHAYEAIPTFDYYVIINPLTGEEIENLGDNIDNFDFLNIK
jgi:hypothetical protein